MASKGVITRNQAKIKLPGLNVKSDFHPTNIAIGTALLFCILTANRTIAVMLR